MNASHSLPSLLHSRFTHNEKYLSQTLKTRSNASVLSYGIRMTDEWLKGEESAIRAENEWILASLRESNILPREISANQLHHHD